MFCDQWPNPFQFKIGEIGLINGGSGVFLYTMKWGDSNVMDVVTG